MEANAGSGPSAAARLAAVRAGVAALEGRTADAKALYADALRGWRETHGVWGQALTGLDMAELLDTTDPEVADVIASTRQILARLGAKPYLARLDAASASADERERKANESPTDRLEIAASS